MPGYVNFYHENANFLKLIFSCNRGFWSFLGWGFWGRRIRIWHSFRQVRHIYQDSIRIVPRIICLKNLKNPHYGIRSKTCDSPNKHAVYNKVDVRSEFSDTKNPIKKVFDNKSPQSMFYSNFKLQKLTFSW